ncbi:MAG: DNA-directed RNA polymerase subunit alpha [Planctomycetes bacterium]|nr:DNA-directed RNA polymerase subunit alpha [Planctomycetota bacterium]
MTQASVDVLGAVTRDGTSAAELMAARRAAARDGDSRRKLAQHVASLPMDPKGASAAKRGIACFVLGRDAQAAEFLAHAGTKPARAARVRALVSTGRPAEAARVAEEVSDDPVAAAAAGDAWADLGDSDKVRAAAAVVAKSGDDAEATYLKGRAAEIDGERKAAMDAFEKAGAAGHCRANFRRARMEYAFGDEETALEFFRKACDGDDVPTNALIGLGTVYEDRGEFTKARECYRRVLENDPVNPRARLFDKDAAAAQNMYYDEDIERRADKRAAVLRLPVTDFELSVRSRNCLAKMGVRTLGDLVQRTEAELLSYKNFGETSLQEIKDILAQKGLRLGMGKDDLAADFDARQFMEGIGGNDADRKKSLAKPLSDLELSVRSRHCMNVLGLKTVAELVSKSEAELMTIKNFGQTSLNEVKQKLAELGLTLAPSAPVK